ncbi:entericidin [Rhizobium leguminosarum]|uniref:entericidin n=1 Tax=Rhizobium leguminosarum TaxID=384 RepID=UPI0024A7D0E2|nr:entericidin [Rhizobium leguminosarum]MDI5925153.1 entericidin [Rhizobium leguminosarum]
MPKAAIAIACICLLTLSGCGNTAYGLKKDGQEASHAMDNATHRMLSAGSKK